MTGKIISGRKQCLGILYLGLSIMKHIANLYSYKYISVYINKCPN